MLIRWAVLPRAKATLVKSGKLDRCKLFLISQSIVHDVSKLAKSHEFKHSLVLASIFYESHPYTLKCFVYSFRSRAAPSGSLGELQRAGASTNAPNSGLPILVLNTNPALLLTDPTVTGQFTGGSPPSQFIELAKLRLQILIFQKFRRSVSVCESYRGFQ